MESDIERLAALAASDRHSMKGLLELWYPVVMTGNKEELIRLLQSGFVELLLSWFAKGIAVGLCIGQCKGNAVHCRAGHPSCIALVLFRFFRFDALSRLLDRQLLLPLVERVYLQHPNEFREYCSEQRNQTLPWNSGDDQAIEMQLNSLASTNPAGSPAAQVSAAVLTYLYLAGPLAKFPWLAKIVWPVLLHRIGHLRTTLEPEPALRAACWHIFNRANINEASLDDCLQEAIDSEIKPTEAVYRRFCIGSEEFSMNVTELMKVSTVFTAMLTGGYAEGLDPNAPVDMMDNSPSVLRALATFMGSNTYSSLSNPQDLVDALLFVDRYMISGTFQLLCRLDFFKNIYLGTCNPLFAWDELHGVGDDYNDVCLYFMIFHLPALLESDPSFRARMQEDTKFSNMIWSKFYELAKRRRIEPLSVEIIKSAWKAKKTVPVDDRTNFAIEVAEEKSHENILDEDKDEY